VLNLSKPHRKHPGADDVIEQVRFAFFPRMLHGPINDWTHRNLDSREQSMTERRNVHRFLQENALFSCRGELSR
jgi:hypothetical protein